MSQTDSGGREWMAGDVVRSIPELGHCVIRFLGDHGPERSDGEIIEHPWFEAGRHISGWIKANFQLCCQTCHAATGGKRWCAEHEPKDMKNFRNGKPMPDLEAMARVSTDQFMLWSVGSIDPAYAIQVDYWLCNHFLSTFKQVDAAARASERALIEWELAKPSDFTERFQNAVQERDQARAEVIKLKQMLEDSSE